MGGGFAGSTISGCDDTVCRRVNVGGFVSLQRAAGCVDFASTDCSQNAPAGRESWNFVVAKT
jgi:hypothetical protein